MAFIDVVLWDAKRNDVFAYKYPETNLSTATQLIVRESQEAVLFSKGKLMGKFGPGRHTLNTENLPILRDLYGIPFGGKNPFTAEVWFVNKTAPLNIDWRTATMRILDPEYQVMIPLTATGRYGLVVHDAEKFLIQLVGSLESFTSAELTDHFMGMLSSKTNSCIMSFMNSNRVGINQIASYLTDLSEFIKQPMTEFWADYGFRLTGFYITKVDLDMSTTEGQKISEALAKKSTLDLFGTTYEGAGIIDAIQDSAKNGSGLGIAAVGILSGMVGIYPNGRGNVNQLPNAKQYHGDELQHSAYIRKEWFCSGCGAKHPVTSQFCDSCGHHYNPCPQCGADNPDHASKCIRCAYQLAEALPVDGVCCWKCRKPVKPGKKFCSNCGARQ